jgi:hypothetical protein
MVRTSQWAAAMILTSTSETPSATAAAIPGAEEKTKRKFKLKEALVDVCS